MATNAASALRALHVRTELLTLAEPFRITGYTFTRIPVIVVRLREGAAVGEGEAAGVYYLGDDAERMTSAASPSPTAAPSRSRTTITGIRVNV